MNRTFYLVDFANAVRLPLLVAAGWLLHRIHRKRSVPPGLRRQLMGLAAGGLLVYTNFGLFHGTGLLHPSELFHYYFSSKYFDELGYDGLYGAALVAGAEARPPFFSEIERARDLRNAQVVDADALRSDPSFRERFAPARWQQFREELRFYHGLQTPEKWKRSLLDHGYNAPPTRTLWTRVIALAFGRPSSLSTHALALLDPLALALLMVAVSRVFGGAAAALFALVFCANPLSTFDWVGGTLLRFDWFVLTGLALCAIERRRFGLAGGLLAAAASLRVFPGLFALGVALRGVFEFAQTRHWPRRHTMFALGFALTGAVLLAASTAAFGVESWTDFLTKIQIHVHGMYRNHIGLRGVVTSGVGLALARVALTGLFLASLRKVDDVQAALVGGTLIFVFGFIASYYYCLLALFALWRPLDSLDRASWLVLTLLLAVPAVAGLVHVTSNELIRTYDPDVFFAGSAAMGVFVVALYGSILASPASAAPPARYFTASM